MRPTSTQPSSMMRVTVYLDGAEYLDMRHVLITRRMSFSEWVRQNIKAELGTGELRASKAPQIAP